MTVLTKVPPYKSITFPKQEYDKRLNDVRRRMQKLGLDVIMINDPANLYYLTGHQTSGYDSFQALVIPLEKEPFTVTRLLEEINIFSRTNIQVTRTFTDIDNPIEIAKSAFSEFGLDNKILGIEKQCFFISGHMQEQIQQSFNNQIVDCSGIVEKSRVVKSELEIEFMEIAARITEAGMAAGKSCFRRGIIENDIAAAVHEAMYRAGGEYPSVPPYISSGPRTIVSHATWEGRTLKDGDCLFFELAGCYRRYHTAMMRTFFLGSPPKELLEAEKIVNEAIEAGLEVMRPGVPAGEVSRVCSEICLNNNIGATQISRCGYSIGIAFAPSWDEGQILSFKDGEQTPLQKNMTFHLIPWMQLPDHQMVMGLSETVRVTDSGGKSFFNFDRQMVIR